MAIAGRVAIVPKGAWSATANYERLDEVRYDNKTFVAKKASVGVTPVDGEYWMLSSEGLDQEQFDELSTAIDDLNMLGYVVPEEMPIQNYVDSDGVFHQRVGRVDLGSLEWNTAPTITSGKVRMYSNQLSSVIKLPESDKNYVNGYCNKYNILTNDDSYSAVKGIAVSHTTGNIYIYDGDYTDATAFKTAMKGIYLYYELATEKTISVDGNEYIDTYKADKGEVCVNLLKPTLETTTKNGVTCTANGDGTYTLNGTASANTLFTICKLEIPKYVGKTFKLVGCPKNGSGTTYKIYFSDNQNNNSSMSDTGNGVIKTVEQWGTSNTWTGYINIISGQTVSKLTFKPMLTTDLSATYDDFVPYTGDKGRINEEVAELNKKVTGMFTLDGTTLTITTE